MRFIHWWRRCLGSGRCRRFGNKEAILVLKLLILDLDETLIHATEKPLERQADFTTELYYAVRLNMPSC